MLYIMGRILARTNTGTGGISSVLHIFKPISGTINITEEELIATGFGFDEGPIQDLDSAGTRTSMLLTLAQQSIDALDLEMILDERSAVNASIALPQSKKGVVTSAAIADADITEDMNVVAAILSDTSPLRLTRVLAAGSPTTGQFTADTGSLGFNAAQEGATVVYNYLKTETNISIQGGTNPTGAFGEMSFSGVIKGTRVNKQIYIPRIVRTGDKNLGVSSAIEDTEMQYRCLVPSGWAKAYAIRNSPYAA